MRFVEEQGLATAVASAETQMMCALFSVGSPPCPPTLLDTNFLKNHAPTVVRLFPSVHSCPHLSPHLFPRASLLVQSLRYFFPHLQSATETISGPSSRPPVVPPTSFSAGRRYCRRRSVVRSSELPKSTRRWGWGRVGWGWYKVEQHGHIKVPERDR